MTMIEIQAVILAALSAAGYSLVFYVKKRAKENPDEFNAYKLLATAIVGLFVGISLELSGVELTQQGLASEIATYAGTVALLESVLKTIYRQFLEDAIQN